MKHIGRILEGLYKKLERQEAAVAATKEHIELLERQQGAKGPSRP